MEANPLALAERRLTWLDARQRVLAQNIAHADTPGFRPRDLTPFAARLGSLTGTQAGTQAGMLAVTDARHMAPGGGEGAARMRADRTPRERTPNGNGVALDEQAMKIAETDQAHALALGLHRKYLGLFRMALGRS